jgi:hypothetical protein
MDTKQIQRHRGKPEKLAVYLSSELADKVRKEAETKLMSQSLFISSVLKQWFEKQDQDAGSL